MIGLTSSVYIQPNFKVPSFKQQVVDYPKQNNYETLTSLTDLRLGYNGIIPYEKNTDVSVKLNTPIDLPAYKIMGQNAVNDVNSRAGKCGQVLNWIKTLPEDQLKNLDFIYDLAAKAKDGDNYTDLVVLGMGGSRYSTESLVGMLGVDSKVHFYSGVEEKNLKHLVDNLDLSKTKFLVVSKSGDTLETTTAYNQARKIMQDYTGKDDVSDSFIAMTAESAEKSNLRKLVNQGDIKLSGVVHDDISGGYSMFDDATIFTLAYAGLDKKDAEKMLQSALKAQKDFLNPDISRNEALQLAAFNVDSKLKGNDKQFINYFGEPFAGAALCEKQVKNEGLKSAIFADTNIAPASFHYITEADLDDNNKSSFYTFVYVKPEEKKASALLSGAIKAYSDRHPVSTVELKDLSPESIARFAELKYFETLYTGNMLRQKNGDITPVDKPLPEVIQYNVKKYKSEVKKNLQD